MRIHRSTHRGVAAFTTALALALTIAGASFAQEEKANPKKPGKTEAQKKPAPAPANRSKPKEDAEKKDRHAKVEIHVRGADGKDGRKVEVEKKGSVHILRSPHSRDQDFKPTPWLGIAMRPVPDSLREYLELDEGFGVQVEHIVAKSPASEAGLKVYDVLTKLDDQRVISPEHVALLVRSKKKGAKIAVTFVRKGKEQSVDVTLGERDLQRYSNAPTRMPPIVRPNPHDRDGGGDGGFGFHFGEPGKKGHFEFQLPGDRKDHEELQRHMKGYGDLLKQWLEKNPDALRNLWNQGDPRRKNQSPKSDQPKSAPSSDKPAAAAEPKPIPPLPRVGVSAGKPPAISVRPGFPLEVFGGAGIVKIDNIKGAVTITANDGEHKITIKNPEGETVYEGPYTAEKGTKGLPKEAQGQLKEMKLDDLKLLMPRPPKAGGPKPEAGSARPTEKGKGKIL